MRPEILFPLFAPLTGLAGVGSRTLPKYERLAGPRVVDLFWHLPVGLIDRRFSPKVNDAPDGAVVTLEVTVGEHKPPRNKRSPYRIVCFDDTAEIQLIFFHARPDYLNRLLPEGETRLVSGRVERFSGRLQISHPDYVVGLEERANLPVIEPVYPLTAGLTLKQVVKTVRSALEKALDLPEWNDRHYLAAQHWLPWKESVLEAHSPESLTDLDPMHPARARLAYDELLANQLALALVRARMRRRKGRKFVGDGALRKKVLEAFPWKLTGSQQEAIGEIEADMASPSRMIRLLQGDVGSGKTIVALIAMLIAVEAGAQAAIVAPTEILARQHFDSIQPLCETAGLAVARLTGRDKGKGREAIVASLAAGEVDIVVGTHALFESDIHFRDLGVAVIDEQHRFGVHQRLKLTEKGDTPVDVLVMTATPIPRTLIMTAYGDMDVARLLDKPPGRKPVDTRTIALSRLNEVVDAAGRAIEGDAQIYWVCPLVEESEVLDIAAAEERYAQLKSRFGNRVGLIHGRLKAPEKDAVMKSFAAGEIRLLVATTVIEVGVDVPDASIMIIEHAERFGLAQLHQLRGRVGRGEAKSSCLLLYGHPVGETAHARLSIMRESDDGFRIAEEDLRLRGAGEVLGTRQSGLPSFRVADLEQHAELLGAARDDAKLILQKDASLKSERGAALRVLLYLFERDLAIRYLESG